MKSLYLRLGFKVFKDFSTSPNLEEAYKKFHYESGKSKRTQKQTIVLKCYLTIPRRFTILCDNQIDKNEYSAVYKYLNEVLPSDDWLTYEYIDAEANEKLDRIKGGLAGDEM